MLSLLSSVSQLAAQDSCWSIGRIKYDGGGDWYASPTGIVNLIARVRKDLGTALCPQDKTIRILDAELSSCPILYMTGHGNVSFSEEERGVLRKHLSSGALLFVDDNYGMDESIRRELLLLFPNRALEVLPNKHPLFSAYYQFEKWPKIHKHDGYPAVALGIEIEGRTVLVYSYQSDLTNGWEDVSLYGDPETIREQAFRMGVNLISWYMAGQRSSK